MLENGNMLQFSLAEGMGFTEACYMTNNDPKKASEYLKSKEGKSDFEAIDRAHRNARMKKLKSIEEMKGHRSELGKADELLEQVRKIPPLVLWGTLLPAAPTRKLDTKTVVTAFLKVRYPMEVATGLGLTYDEYVDYIRDNDLITAEIRRLGLTIPLV